VVDVRDDAGQQLDPFWMNMSPAITLPPRVRLAVIVANPPEPL
jgi:hypothetical protein